MVTESGVDENTGLQVPHLWSKLKKIPGIGILFAVIAGLFFSTGSLTVKLITSISGVEVVVFKSLVNGISSLIVALVKGESLRPSEGEGIPLLARTIFAAFGLILAYSAIELLPLSDSYALFSASPVFVTIFACVLLKEPCGLIQVGSIILALTGITLISRPSFIFYKDDDGLYANTRTLGTILALSTCIMGAASLVTLRALRTTPTLVVIVWYSVLSTLSALGYCLFRGELVLPASNIEYGLLLLCSICGIVGQGFTSLAIKLENAASISIAGTFEILMAFVYQITVLHGKIPWTSAIGAAILLSGVISIALDKWYQNDPAEFKRTFLCQKSDPNEVQSTPKKTQVRIRTFSTMSTIDLA